MAAPTKACLNERSPKESHIVCYDRGSNRITASTDVVSPFRDRAGVTFNAKTVKAVAGVIKIRLTGTKTTHTYGEDPDSTLTITLTNDGGATSFNPTDSPMDVTYVDD